MVKGHGTEYVVKGLSTMNSRDLAESMLSTNQAEMNLKDLAVMNLGESAESIQLAENMQS